MLTQDSIKDFARKYQTSEMNIVQEYMEHLFLAALYKLPHAEKLLFKGGTALRVIFQSPRFSEDVDFTGVQMFHHAEVDKLFLSALAELEKSNISISLRETKPTTGGYLGIIHFEIFDFVRDMKFEVSFRQKGKLHGETVSIVSDFTVPYNLVHFPAQQMVSEKLDALLTRKKARDFYDLYFILRHRGLRPWVPKRRLPAVLETIHNAKINFKSELVNLLPFSHQIILKDFKKTLVKEVQTYI